MYHLTGELITANHQAAMMYGAVSVEDLLKEVKTVFDFLTDEGKTHGRLSFHRTLAEGKPQRNEYQVKIRNGKIIDTEMHSSIVWTASGEPWAFISVVRDITERRRAENELKKSQESLKQNEMRYRSILDNMEEAYYEVDLKGNNTFFNSSALKSLGYTKEEMLGMNYLQYVDEEDAKKVFAAFNRVFHTGETIRQMEWVLKTKDGRKVPVEGSVSLIRDIKGNPSGFSGVIRDITDRRSAQDRLRESEEKYRGILENMDDAYYETDLFGNYIFFNEALVSKTGYSRDELTGMN
jgi:PAS domain S-box-containing protein